MRNKIDTSILLDIFQKGISNNEFFNRKKEGCSFIKCLLKILRLLCFRLFGGMTKRLTSHEVRIIWYPLHERVLGDKTGTYVVLLDHKNKLNGYSFLFYLPFGSIIHSCFATPRGLLRSRLAYDWCFFSNLVAFLSINNINSITIAGHYDKFATWISYLAKDMGICLTISQHGANSKYKLPYKIPVNRLEIFSKAEEDMFRSTILEPEKTEFYIKGFHSSLTFSAGGFETKTVAIASQPGYEDRIVGIIEILQRINDKLHIVVYSHPSDQFRKGFKTLNLGAKCELEHQARYYDVDYLIVFTSTLAYDYWSCLDFKGRVLCCYDKNCVVALYDDERATVLYPETYEFQLKEILS